MGSAACVLVSALTLSGLQGQVLRLRGVVDRFGTYQQQGQLHQTICIRNIEIANSGEALDPDHWWFRLRQAWCEAGVQAGDTVIFTVKVRHCSKGVHEPELVQNRDVRSRERVLGLAGQVRDLVVQRRGRIQGLQIQELEAQVRRQQLLREQAEAEMNLLQLHRDALLAQVGQLQHQLSTWKARCQILDPGLANQGRTRAPRGARHCKGFQRIAPVMALQRR